MMAIHTPALQDIREKGQVWTPSWIADVMAAYAMKGGSGVLFDPACGCGALLAAGKREALRLGLPFQAEGMDIDSRVLSSFASEGLSEEEARRIRIADFLEIKPKPIYESISVNPPYLRHHRIPPEQKAALQTMASEVLGQRIDARAGLHVYFLIHALRNLAPGGRLSFIVSSDICEGVFAPKLWNWIARNYCLEGVLRFSREATPFPSADTNALLLFLKNAEPAPTFAWAECFTTKPGPLVEWIESDFKDHQLSTIHSELRFLDEGISTGLSRPPVREHSVGMIRLGDIASVLRGIATGANDFFLMTREQAEARNLPESFLKPCIARVRDLDGDRITPWHLKQLEAKGRPTFLLDIPPVAIHTLPGPVQDYIREGEASGFNLRPLIRMRRPWYRMEQRKAPPLLFSYLGRRECRFILNEAQVLPLSCLLCVYPKVQPTMEIWRQLNRPETLAGLSVVGKSYGGGAIKVEPRALERLPIAGVFNTGPFQPLLIEAANA